MYAIVQGAETSVTSVRKSPKMNSNIFSALIFLFLSIPGATAVGTTDYSTLEALCIAILVLFLIWIIVIIILIFCCRAYIDKLSHAPSEADDKPGRSDGNSNHGYQNEQPPATTSNTTYVRTSSDPKVHPAPEYRRPEVRNQVTQTNPCYLEPLGPSTGSQTGPENEEPLKPPHRLGPILQTSQDSHDH